MYSIKIPEVKKGAKTNKLGRTKADYQGAVSTLCGGCGHDSVTAAIVESCFELNLEPHMLAKMSGIGCSSKTTGYFVRGAHGFNAVHGRMPSVTTGAQAANREMTYIGISGDGDTGSIGIGQYIHAVRRNLNMLYIIENNGVYGLTKGQFSAIADMNSKNKKGQVNTFLGIDPLKLAIQCGASFVARSFSGQKEQIIPLIKAGLMHKGFAVIDVISPCVSFNNHLGSTKSYQHVREHSEEPVHLQDYIPARERIEVDDQKAKDTQMIELHDHSRIYLQKARHNPTDPTAALAALDSQEKIITGLIYIDAHPQDFHEKSETVATPLRDIKLQDLRPKTAFLDHFNATHR